MNRAAEAAAFRVAVPGKLMVAGEYAVLEPGHACIVTAVNRRVVLTVTPGEPNRLDLPDLGLSGVRWEVRHGQAHFDSEDPRLAFIGEAISSVAQYLPEDLVKASAHLQVNSELDDASGRKYGLGSSAAVVVGVVAALLRLVTGETAKPELVFRLAAVAHFRGQGSGSGADVAASTFGGWLRYESFSPGWMKRELAAGWPLKALVDDEWPHLLVEPVNLPETLELCVGWTGTPAATGPMLERIRRFRNDAGPEYQRFLTASDTAVDGILAGCAENDAPKLLRGLSANRDALQQLGIAAEAPIETELLSRLAALAWDAGGVGKSSGSGAGDCGIAFISPEYAEGLRALWSEAGILPLNLEPMQQGVVIEAVG